MEIKNSSSDKVSLSNLGRAKNADKADKANQAEGNEAQSGQLGDAAGTKLDISNDSKVLAKGIEVARNSDLDNEEKIEQIKELIKQGKYQADAGKIADGMMREHTLSELL